MLRPIFIGKRIGELFGYTYFTITSRCLGKSTPRLLQDSLAYRTPDSDIQLWGSISRFRQSLEAITTHLNGP
jgi:hypothetical protein